MKITNRYGLPEPIVEAVRNDGYSRGDADMSVTQLVDSPRVVAIEREHKNEIEEDASELLMPLLGQATHVVLERANATGLAERRLTIEIEGWKISGGMDLVCKDRILTDYKVTNIHKLKGGNVPPEFEAQVNCYAAILRANGEEVTALQVVGILRDWRKAEWRREANYPPRPIIAAPVRMWTQDEALAYMRERVILHKQAQIKLPDCSPEERWARPDTWALMKTGGKRAIKVYDNEADASAHASTGPGLRVESRPGESVRCAAYCSASQWCAQFQATKPVQAEDESEAI